MVQQSLQAGLLEELQIHLAPVLLGEGVRLFDRVDPGRLQLAPPGWSILRRSRTSGIASPDKRA